MPTKQPTVSFQHIRSLTEQWSWTDPATGVRVTGFNVPAAARPSARQVPYFVSYVTGNGNLEQGEVITLKVDLRRHQRKVLFPASGEIRIIRDYLIIQINGIRVITN